MTPVRWGILSTALIAAEKVVPAMRTCGSLLQVAAIASRSQAAADAAAAALGIPVAYGSYEALLADPAIEAVYNPLPNHLHVPFNAPQGEPTRDWIDRGGALDGSDIEAFTLPAADQYQLQAEAFSHAVRNDPPDAAALDDAQANLRVLDALFASKRSGQFERPAP